MRERTRKRKIKLWNGCSILLSLLHGMQALCPIIQPFLNYRHVQYDKNILHEGKCTPGRGEERERTGQDMCLKWKQPRIPPYRWEDTKLQSRICKWHVPRKLLKQTNKIKTEHRENIKTKTASWHLYRNNEIQRTKEWWGSRNSCY